MAFNISVHEALDGSGKSTIDFGTFYNVSKARLGDISMGMQRQLIPYDAAFHSKRAIYFPGHDENRMLTHWYSFLFLADPRVDRLVKRFARDRLRYRDEIFCAAGRFIDLLKKQVSGLSQDRDRLPGHQMKNLTPLLTPIQKNELSISTIATRRNSLSMG